MTTYVQNQLPRTSRVWVYQSNRAFSNEEVGELTEILNKFNASWEAHGTKLNSAIEIFYNQFIVFFVDETGQNATGCSIDKSMGIIKEIQSKFNVDLLDRMNLTYRDGSQIKNIKMGDFQDGIQKGIFTPETIVFNNLVTTKATFLDGWETQAKFSWHKNLF